MVIEDSQTDDSRNMPSDGDAWADRAGVNNYSDEALATIVAIHRRLGEDYGPLLGNDVVARVLAEAVAEFSRTRFTTYVPLLIEKAARDRLRASAKGLPEREV